MFDLAVLKEHHNIIKREGGFQARPAFYKHTDVTSGSVYVWGTSIEAPNTGDVFHYIVQRATSTGIATLYCYTESFRAISSLELGPCPIDAVVTCALSDRQLLFNSPQWAFAVYALVGGGMRRAVATASVNPDTTAIAIPTGLIAEFSGRFVIAAGTTVYFSDPGVTAKETFVAENALALPAIIYDLFVGPGGMLVMATADGVYALASDSVAGGQIAFGLLQKISPYQCRSWRNVCFAQGRMIALSAGGFTEVTETLTALPLVTYPHKRNYAKAVGVGSAGDYRFGQIWATQDLGAVVSLNGNLCSILTDQGLRVVWITTQNALALRGVLRTRDGKDLYLTDASVLELWGNTEFGGQTFRAVACGSPDVPIEQSTVVRAVHSASDNIAHMQMVYLGGQTGEKTTPAPSRAANIVGTSLWGAEARYTQAEMRSRRHDFAFRTDEVSLEIAIDEPTANIGGFAVVTKDVSINRPTN